MGNSPIATKRHAVGQKIRAARQDLNMTQEALADAVTDQLGSPIHKTAITKIEAGQRAISLEEAIALSNSLAIPLVDIAKPYSGENIFDRTDRILDRFGKLGNEITNFHEESNEIIQEISELVLTLRRIKSNVHDFKAYADFFSSILAQLQEQQDSIASIGYFFLDASRVERLASLPVYELTEEGREQANERKIDDHISMRRSQIEEKKAHYKNDSAP